MALDLMANLILKEGRSVMVPPAWVAGLFGWGMIGARKLNSDVLKSSPESVRVELGRRATLAGPRDLEAEVTRI